MTVGLQLDTPCLELTFTLEHDGVSATLHAASSDPCEARSGLVTFSSAAFAGHELYGRWLLHGSSKPGAGADLAKWTLTAEQEGSSEDRSGGEPSRGRTAQCPSWMEAHCAELRTGGLEVKCCYSSGWYCGYAGEYRDGVHYAAGEGCD